MDHISNSDSEALVSNTINPNKGQHLEAIVEQCTEYRNYFPEPVRQWHDLINIADKLVPMLGIDRPVFDAAIKTMGLKHAAAVVLCILEKIAKIHNPGGFLRRLTQAAHSGQFDWGRVAPKHRVQA